MSVLAFSGADASAATALALADEELVAVAFGITQIVQNKSNDVIIWNSALHGERCNPLWTAPLIFSDGPGTNF
jgi:hypothetical protein